MIFPIVIASALLAFTALPQGVLSAQPEPCPQGGTRLGVAYSGFEFQGQGQVLVAGCNKFPNSLTVSSYQLLPGLDVTCQFVRNPECHTGIGSLWDATDRSDRWVHGGNNQAKSANCFRRPQDSSTCSAISKDYVGAVYDRPNLLGAGQGLNVGCNDLSAFKFSSIFILPIDIGASCKFYKDSICKGDNWPSFKTSILDKQDWMGQAQSVYCALNIDLH